MKRSDFPKAYDPKAVEDAIYARWERSGFFNPDKLPRERGKPGKRGKAFSIVMPPPNVTGTLHVGHAVMLALEDLMIRYHRMRGDRSLWIPGTDHAAIATQTKVEKKLWEEQKKTRHDLGREAFLREVEKFARDSKTTIHRQIRKMGSSCDWSREAYTLDKERTRAVRTMFQRMYEDGLIYRGNRIVNWCPRCASTLSDDEVEHREERAKLFFIRYKIKGGEIVVATARPETKLGDTAVAVHPKDSRYKKFIGKEYDVDLAGHNIHIRVVADAVVDPKFGTGAVGVTPAHSFIDFEIAERHKIPLRQVIGEDGHMAAEAGSYAGLPVADARRKFVDDLRRAGLIEKEEDYTHNVSVCYRCGTTIEPLPKLQWFVDVNKKISGRKKTLKELASAVVRSGEIEIIPKRFTKVYFQWMDNLRDWCISRQIWFGHQVPVWYCKEMQSAKCKAKGGIVVSGETPKSCPHCGAKKLEQDPDTLDTWFSSGLWTFSTLGWPQKRKAKSEKRKTDLEMYHPTSVLETGYDILFFWVARMILMTTYALGEVPFRTVYLHGLVRDAQGRKMSKSLGNIIDPLDVSAKYGTDAVRLSLILGTAPGADTKLWEEKIAGFRNFTNKLWNIARFVAAASHQPSAISHQPPEAKTLADRWILARLGAVTREVTRRIERFEFSAAGELLREFTWSEVADWYLEISKVEKGKGEILAFILDQLLRLWHPFMPFVTEEIWGRMFARGVRDFLMVQRFPEAKSTRASDAVKDFALIQGVVSAIRAARSSYRIPPAKKIQATVIAAARAGVLRDNGAVISALAGVTELTVKERGKRPPRSVAAVVEGVEVYVPVGELVQLEAERARIAKAIAEASGYLATLDAKLSNENFVNRAPAEIVNAEREKQTQAQGELTKLSEQLAALE